MKKLAGLLAALFLLQGGAALAQVSDYEIISGYRGRHESLLESIRTARDPQRCEELERAVGGLEAEYAPHAALLGEGLHPETFAGSIGALREQLEKAKERVTLAVENVGQKETIRTLAEKTEADDRKIVDLGRQNEEYRVSVDKLTQEVQGLSARIEQLAAENSGLVEQVNALRAENRRDQESIAKLKALNETLTANIRTRDELIIRMMDTMFGEYAKSGLTDEQRKNLFVNVQGNDYVGTIVSTIDGNVAYAESAVMEPRDVEVVRAEQRRLAGKWDAIKPYVGNLYPEEQAKTRDLATVDSRLAEWKRRVDESTWRSVHQVFASRNIGVGSFRSAAEFQAALLAYIDEQANAPSRSAYRKFREQAWDSPIKSQWLPIIPLDELTAQQRGDIEARIAVWDRKVAALLWRWVIIGALGAAVIAALAGFALLRARKRRPAPAA